MLCMTSCNLVLYPFFFFQAEDGIRYLIVTGVQTCALPIFRSLGGCDVTALLVLGRLVQRVGKVFRINLVEEGQLDQIANSRPQRGARNRIAGDRKSVV